MNFVALWIAKSAPKLSARWSRGEANVPSTATAHGAAHKRSSSAISTSGLLGVSTYSSAAPSQAAKVASVSVVSTPTS